MAKSYIKEIGDKLSRGKAATEGDHIKTIAPVYYRPADNSADSAVTTIQGELDNRLVATSGTKALSWGSSTTIGTVGGSDVKISLPDNPDKDEKVKLTDKSSATGSYPLVLASASSPTSGTAYEGYYDTGVKLTPSTNTISANISGNAATADKLATSRSLKTDLGSTTAVTFDGSANQDAIPITGTLGVAHGGTGATTLTSNALVTGNGTSAVKLVATNNGALYATSANGAAQFGTLPIAQGGTGATTNTAAEYNLINGKTTELSGAPQDTYRFAFLNTSVTTSSGVIAGYRTAGTIKTWVKDFMSSGGTSLNATNAKVTTATTTKLFLTGVNGDPTTSGANKALYTDTGIYATTTSGELNATQFKVNEHCTMQYNSTKSALDFVFS